MLADLAKTSSPVAYGAAALYALHRLLQMVMPWQRHRLDIAERDLQLQHLREVLQEESRAQKARFYNARPEDLTDLGQREDAARRPSGEAFVSDALRHLGPFSEEPHLDEAVRAARRSWARSRTFR